MSIVDEINKDLEKMGGDTSGNTLEEAMDKFGDEIIEKIGEATELPEVSSDDEGKVLTVNSEGKWDAEDIPAPEPELPVVTSEDAGDVLTVNSEGEWVPETPESGAVIANIKSIGTTSCDKTFNELTEAYQNGQEIVPFYAFRATMGPEVRNVVKGNYFVETGSDQSIPTSFHFTFIYVYNTALKFREVIYTSSGLTESDTKTITTT